MRPRAGEAIITLFYGVPGAGKTTAMMDYVSAHSDEHRFLVVDRAGEWGSMDPEQPDQPNPRWRGKTLPIVVVDKGNLPEPWPETGIFLFQYPWEGPEVAQLVKDIGEAVYVDDEIDLVAVFKGWAESPLRDFVHRGRHLPNAQGEIGKVHILGAARRPQNLHTDLTSLADQTLIFRVQGHRTIDRLVADGMIDDSDIVTVRTMPNLDYKLWRSDGHTEWGRVTDPFKSKATK